jgi:hypothetical protein
VNTYNVRVTRHQYEAVESYFQSAAELGGEYITVPAKMRDLLRVKSSGLVELTAAEIDRLVEQLDWQTYDAWNDGENPTWLARARRQQTAIRRDVTRAGYNVGPNNHPLPKR